MSKKTQGTQLYIVDPADDSVITVACATSMNAGGNPADQLDDTCLEDQDRKYKKGLRTPGQAAITINADPSIASHKRLHELSQDDTIDNLQMAIGWSDGTDAPTVDSNGDFVFPTTRSWLSFEGYIVDFPFDFQMNSLVASNIPVQRSGKAILTAKIA